MQSETQQPARVFADDPSLAIEFAFNEQWQTGRQVEPLSNPALEVAALGFVRHAGDWLGVVVTPWSFELLLLPGGGELWGEIPLGQTRYLSLPGMTLPFLAKMDEELGPYQAASLVTQITALSDMPTARRLADDALRHALALPAQLVEPAVASVAPEAETTVEKPAAPLSRRGFFRRLAGKR